MPRKPSKTAAGAENSAQEGVDIPQPTQIVQILENQAAQGKPEVQPAKGEEAKKIGRPSKYIQETAPKMCELLSEGIPLREICRMGGMPAWRTVYDWMYKDDALGEAGVGLSAAFARARDVGYEALAEECLIIADNVKIGIKKTFSSGSDEDEDSMTVVEEDMLGHRKLQIETRLKLLAKWNPKKYGDKLQVGGDPESPLEVKNEAMDILAAAVKNLELKRQTANE